MFAELNVAAGEIGVSLVGGHTEVTVGLDRPILVGTMLGTTDAAGLITPAQSKPGDRVLMTRSAGIEGTALIANEFRSRLLSVVDSAVIDRAANFLEEPGISVLSEASALSRACAVSAMHDPTEGGIATAIREIAEAAGCGAVIAQTAIPVAPETSAICDALGLDPLGLLSSGALLAIVPAERMAAAASALDEEGTPYSWIGKLAPRDAGVSMRVDDHYVDFPVFVVDELARLMAGAE
jgi:hydrogenase maturation factor